MAAPATIENTIAVADIRDRPTVTVEEAANLLGISEQSYYRAVRNDRLPSIRLGRRVIVPTRPLLQLLGEGDA